MLPSCITPGIKIFQTLITLQHNILCCRVIKVWKILIYYTTKNIFQTINFLIIVHVLTWRAQKMHSATSSEDSQLVRIVVLCAQTRLPGPNKLTCEKKTTKNSTLQYLHYLHYPIVVTNTVIRLVTRGPRL